MRAEGVGGTALSSTTGLSDTKWSTWEVITQLRDQREVLKLHLEPLMSLHVEASAGQLICHHREPVQGLHLGRYMNPDRCASGFRRQQTKVFYVERVTTTSTRPVLTKVDGCSFSLIIWIWRWDVVQPQPQRFVSTGSLPLGGGNCVTPVRLLSFWWTWSHLWNKLSISFFHRTPDDKFQNYWL